MTTQKQEQGCAVCGIPRRHHRRQHAFTLTRPAGMVRCPDHRNGGATFCPRGGAALQQWQRRQWGE